MPSSRSNLLLVALFALPILSLWQLRGDERGITRESLHVGETPVTVYRSEARGEDRGEDRGQDRGQARDQARGSAPVVLVAHGFAGSRRLMEPFALALAGSGYVVVTYDFLGHGRHPLPMRGDLMEQDGTPAFLIEQTREVAEAALGLPGVDGRLAVVGHSMATNILVRCAQEDPRVMATVGVSTFAPTVDEASPRNLLVMVGALEGRLEAEGRRVVAMRTGGEPESVAAFTTYGELSDGTARRLVVSPRVTHTPGGADAPWRRLFLVAGLPALVTPLLLRPLPTGFLPVVMGAGGMVAFFLVLMAWPLDRFFTSFFPVAECLPLMLAVLVGTLPHFLADEWLTRGANSRRGAYPFTKLLFLLSLALAVGLDFQALFFLAIIFVVILIFFLVHGLFSRWAFRSTGSPLVAGLGNAVAFAWAMAVTFPMYAGV
jgi:pimeloyl-ACP methyl ester carboxylesterase